MSAQLGGGTEDQLLIELHRATSKVAADQAGVLGLGLVRIADRAREHRVCEAGREPLELGFDQIGDLVVGLLVAGREVRVAVQRVASRWGTRRVIERVLADDQRRTLWHLSASCGLRGG